jgi:TetR/AcrR family transcriptional regulator, repressor for neighboring sulfatase
VTEDGTSSARPGGRSRHPRSESAGHSNQRSTREETVERILDAAEYLFATHGPEEVTVRDIGARAGVSHALVHRYLGSKEDVFNAVMRRNQDRMVAAAGDATELRLALSRMIAAALSDRREYITLMAHASLHGVPLKADVRAFPGARLLVRLAAAEAGQGREVPRLDKFDHRFVVAAVVALVYGWVAVEPWLREATDLENCSDEEVVDGLLRMAVRMLGQEAEEVEEGERSEGEG